MALKDVFKVSRKTFFNPRAWLDYDFLRAQTLYLWSAIRALFTVPTPTREETFEQAMERMKVSESDIDFLAHRYRLFALLFVICALGSFLYGFFLLFRYWVFFGWILAMAVSALFASQAFRYDFWAYQLRNRKLGATFQEWKESILGK